MKEDEKPRRNNYTSLVFWSFLFPSLVLSFWLEVLCSSIRLFFLEHIHL